MAPARAGISFQCPVPEGSPLAAFPEPGRDRPAIHPGIHPGEGRPGGDKIVLPPCQSPIPVESSGSSPPGAWARFGAQIIPIL